MTLVKSTTCLWFITLLALPALNLRFSAALAQSAQPIYSFTGGNDGAAPSALTLGPNGNFYGTTDLGGSNNEGTVFEVTTNGALITLHTFTALINGGGLPTNSDGAVPKAGLALGPDGNFYGTISGGGSGGGGTVFEITTNGTLTTLVNFAGTNGNFPDAALTLGPNGNFYGTTAEGGSNSDGTVFEVTTNGTLTTLVNFARTNGFDPEAALTLGPDGNFYGTTLRGGSSPLGGTVFKMTTNGTLTTLFNFALTNGRAPEAGLTLGPDGNFYGTTEAGGSNSEGTVFKITTNGALTTLHSFTALNGGGTNSDGVGPFAGLALGPGGIFYGTTTEGGSGGDGTLFEMTTNGALTTLVNFVGTNGAFSTSALTPGPSGNFYGTTIEGGSGAGVIYLLNLLPGIIQQPVSQAVVPGSQVTFSVVLSSTLPYSFQWLFNDAPIAADTNSTLTLPDVTFTNAGGYSVIVTDASGSVTSSVAVLTVAITPTISTNPASATVSPGSSVTLSVSAGGTDLSYQWAFNGTNIAGATNATFVITNVSLAGAGSYTVTVSNPLGSVTSAAASVASVGIEMFAGVIVDGPLGSNYLIQATSNLTTNWTTLTNVALPSQPYIFIDYNSPTNRQQFYRAIPQ